jgi:hypothetical protein
MKYKNKQKQKNENTNFQILRGFSKQSRQNDKWRERKIRRQTPRL